MTRGSEVMSDQPGVDWQRLTREVEHTRGLDAAAIERYLAELAAQAPALSHELRRHLPGARPRRGGFMATSVASLEGAVEERLPSGTVLGVWRLVELIGFGGMGEVYRAERSDGLYEQTVALKLLRLAETQAVQRFERERRRLAQMDHPGIARIIDGGTASDGRPYLVMEFIEGLPIDVHVREHANSLRAILSLFDALCAAVAHAHGRLILHQDIKPANVLVDRTGQLRLLDFGIAAVLEEDDPDAARAMTLAYAAPEQLFGQTLGVATDIFALGALLHELLVGRPPLRQPDGSVALDPAVPNKADLVAILRRATAFDPADRYATVAAMADDLVALRRHRPVAARQGGGLYKAGKFLRRYPLQSALVSGVVLAVSVGLVATTTFARRAEREAAFAIAEAERANVALAQAERQYEFADANLLGQRAYVDLLRELFGGEDGGRELTARLMERWRALHADWPNAEDAAAALSFALGRGFYFRRDFASADEVFTSWLDEGYGPPMLQDAGRELHALTLFDAGRREEALPLLRQILAAMEAPGELRRSAVDRFNVALRIAAITASAEDIDNLESLHALRAEEFGVQSRTPSQEVENLAGPMQISALRRDHVGTARVLREMLAVYERNPGFAAGRDIARARLAEVLLLAMDRRDETESLARLIVTEDVAASGESAITARGWYLLGRALIDAGRFDEAEAALARGRELQFAFGGGVAPGREYALAEILLLGGRQQIDAARAELPRIRDVTPGSDPRSWGPQAEALLSLYLDAMSGTPAEQIRERLMDAFGADPPSELEPQYLYRMVQRLTGL